MNPLFGLILALLFFTSGTAAAQSSADHVLYLSFSDSLTGWAVGPVKTGGYTQKDTSANTRRKNLYKSMILKTANGGSSWDLQTVIQSGEEAPQINAVFALDRKHCWIAMSQEFNDKDFILRTEDGVSWKALPFVHSEIQVKKLVFTDVKNGWLIGSEMFGEDRLYRTLDGGATWSRADIGYEGSFRDMVFSGMKGYVTANLKADPSVCSILRTEDGGDIWIVAGEIKPDRGTVTEGTAIRVRNNNTYILTRTFDPESPESAHSDLVYSDDGFVSMKSYKVDYEKESKTAETVLDELAVTDSGLIGVEKLTFDSYSEASSRYANVIGSSDNGATWRMNAVIENAVFNFVVLTIRRAVYSSGDGTIHVTENAGAAWRTGEINFKNIFMKPYETETVSPLGQLYTFMDEEDSAFDHDTTYSSKWDSRADSLMAVNFSKIADVKKYKVDTSLDFAVGIDSLYSTSVVLSKRVRYGSKHQTWDLIKEEALTGEIRIRKYKTMRLAGRVHAANGRKAARYNWSSSISGDLSDQLSFTTSAKQLVPGTHFIFFKAMDDRGQWSDPMVIKVTVEDFPKYKFPFDGLWSAGGGGSYYNRGHHVRGIRYALDLNYQEGSDGGDSDYGVPVRASTDGVVTFAGYVKGYGRMVKIDYMYGGHKYTTLVSHLATISVEVGEKVKQGQELGGCGSTGRSSAPHIHWELRIDDQCTPPEPIFENDSTIVQNIKDGAVFRSDNRYQPEHIVVVDEGDIPNTYRDYRGYYHSYRYAGVLKNTKTVEAVWKPKLPRSGAYKVQVHIPKKFAVGMALYRVYSKAGVQEVKVNQNKFTDEWVTLGTYEFDAADNVYVALNNMTGQTRGTIAFDAVRFIGQFEGKQTGIGMSK